MKKKRNTPRRKSLAARRAKQAAAKFQKLVAIPKELEEIRTGKRCFLCGAVMSRGHLRTHRDLRRSVAKSSSSASPDVQGSSIWGVSGGLPSLGKRK